MCKDNSGQACEPTLDSMSALFSETALSMCLEKIYGLVFGQNPYAFCLSRHSQCLAVGKYCTKSTGGMLAPSKPKWKNYVI